MLTPLLVVSFDATWDEDMTERQNGEYSFHGSFIFELLQLAFALIFCETLVKEERGERKHNSGAQESDGRNFCGFRPQLNVILVDWFHLCQILIF